MSILFYYEDGKIQEYRYDGKLKRRLLPLPKPKIGVISHKNLVFIKKSYPKNVKKDLKKIVEREIESLFEGQNYVYFYQIINQTDSQIELTLWAYKGDIKDELVRLGCSYIIPEPLLYSFQELTLMLYQTSEFYLLTISKNKLILNFLATKRFSKEIVHLFIKGINVEESMRLIIYSSDELNIEELFDEKIQIEKKSLPPFPLFLDFIQYAKLKNFRIRNFQFQRIDLFFVLRIMIYSFVALSLNFYMSNLAYDRKVSELDNAIKKLKTGTIGSNQMQILNKIEELRQKKQDIIYIIKSLSNLLPQGTVIRKINITENSIEILISTQAPLIVLNNLSFEECFATVKLASPILREGDRYNMELKIGVKKCKYQEKK